MNYTVLKYSVISWMGFAKTKPLVVNCARFLGLIKTCCNWCPLVNHNVKTKAFGQGAGGVMCVALS